MPITPGPTLVLGLVGWLMQLARSLGTPVLSDKPAICKLVDYSNL